MKHTFVICAYQKSEYLEACIKSLKRQTLSSEILMVTSTLNDHISGLAESYGIPLIVNEGEGGITQDWNFALSQVKTEYATIAHQDDKYEPHYTEKLLRKAEEAEHPLILFSDYYELRGKRKVYQSKMLKIKRLLLSPLRIGAFSSSIFVRRRVLSMGDPICCPSVMFCLKNLQQPIFRNYYRSCEDWEAWEKLSKEKGDFLYVAEPLMCHRIHEDSETSKIIQDGKRVQENYEMYCKFWPASLAGLINHFYTDSEKSNKL